MTYDQQTAAVSMSGQVVGTVGGGWMSDLVIIFDEHADAARIEAVVNAITFTIYGNDHPPAGDIAITATFNDGGNIGAGGPLSDSLTGTLTIVAADDQATVTATTDAAAFVEGGTAAAPFTGVSVANVDGALERRQPECGTQCGPGRRRATAVSYDGASSGTPLAITFTSADATHTAVQALVGQLRYANLGDDPTVKDTDTARVATLIWNDGGNTGTTAADGSLISTITVIGVNNGPVVTFSEGSNPNR